MVPLLVSVDGCFNIIVGNQEGLRWDCFYPMWFVVSIFVIRIVCSLCKEKWYLMMMFVMFVVGFCVGKIAPSNYDYFQICTTAICYPFFLMGTVLKKYDGIHFPDRFNPILRFFLIAIIIVICVLLIWFNGKANVFRCETGKNTLLYYFICIAFSYCLLYIISKLCTKNNTIAMTIPQGTLLVLGLHRIFLKGIIYSLPKNTFTALAVAFLVMLICYPLIILARRYFPAIIGGRGATRTK